MTSEARAREPRRADAIRNRKRILEAATEVFGRVGVDAQMVDVAKAAGLGVATLYRTYPTKEAMVHAMVLERMIQCRKMASEAAQDDDAWRALVRCFYFLTNLQLENRVLAQFLTRQIVGTPEILKERDEVYKHIGNIVERAQAAGQLRADVNVTDIRKALVTTAGISLSESSRSQRLVRRFIGIVLDGLRAPGREPLEGPPLSLSEAEDAFAVRRKDGKKDGKNEVSAFRRGRRAWP